MINKTTTKPIIPELYQIEHGKYVKRLDFLRMQSPNVSPEEIYLALNPATVEDVAQTQFARWGRRLETWRNGLILLPLLITWISLGLASLAYKTNSVPSNQSFLTQWINGFPGSGSLVLGFFEVVAIDAVLLAILLVLTVCAPIIESRAHKRAAYLRSWLEDELHRLASTSLVRSLGYGIENKRPQWAVEVYSATSQLNRVLAGVESLVESSQQSLTNLLDDSQTTFKNLVLASQGTFEDSIRQFGQLVSDQGEAVAKFYDIVNDYQRKLIIANTEMVSTLQRIALTNEERLAVEHRLGQQINILNNIQQTTFTRTEAIAASMSTTAQSVMQIAEQFASQPQNFSIQTEGDVTLNLDKSKTKRVFDVFLCYDGEDKPAVKAIAEQLQIHGITPWLDEWEIPPGMPWQHALEEQISQIKTVAVFLGKSDTGPWQNLELRAFLQEFVERSIPVIPVILPGYDDANPILPPFLRSFTWVDFRQEKPDPLETLTWGVTGRR